MLLPRFWQALACTCLTMRTKNIFARSTIRPVLQMRRLESIASNFGFGSGGSAKDIV